MEERIGNQKANSKIEAENGGKHKGRCASVSHWSVVILENSQVHINFLISAQYCSLVLDSQFKLTVLPPD